MISPLLVLTVLASVASVVSLAIAAPSARSRVLHVVYAVVLTAVAGAGALFVERSRQSLDEAAQRESALRAELAFMESRAAQARTILETYPRYSADAGPHRGFILLGFSFLETHRAAWPETYEIAKRLVIEGLRVTESAGSIGTSEFYDERKRLEDGAGAMRSILQGIAGKAGTSVD